MSRVIEFRAKTTYDNDIYWCYGGYVKANEHSIVEFKKPFKIHNNINMETLCQYTGKKDKDGTKIFDGDILEIEYKNTKIIMLVFWNEITSGWSIENIRLIDFIEHNKSDLQFLNGMQDKIKVIGNKFDNDNLIKMRSQAEC